MRLRPDPRDIPDFPADRGVPTSTPRVVGSLSFAEERAMDSWLDNLHSILTAIGQRAMTGDQVDRYGRILAEAKGEAIARVRRQRRTA